MARARFLVKTSFKKSRYRRVGSEFSAVFSAMLRKIIRNILCPCRLAKVTYFRVRQREIKGQTTKTGNETVSRRGFSMKNKIPKNKQ